MPSWYGFQLAAEEVERRLGVTWGLAQKLLLKAIEKGALNSQPSREGGGPDVLDVDLFRWLEAKEKPSKSTPKQDLAKQAIRKLWPDGIPKEIQNKQIEMTRFRRHRVRCFDGAGGGSWRDGSLPASSSLRRYA